ncbi:MAG: radical SAM protein [Rhodobacteraceae bacterium]|nr:radical SAM protein [Paracoccaceae bacterium]
MQPDIILLSAYLQHYSSVVEIGKLARAQGIPLILGGPMFNLQGVSQAWRSLPGLTAVVGSESDLTVPALVRAACDGGDLLAFDGVALPDGTRSRAAPPLRDLDRTPIADFTDFPWDRYPFRIVPVMTGRGCQWNRCVFCSDVVSVNGRTFRTRSVDSVMVELREQARRHATTNFLFIDLKLNSNPNMLRGVAENIQRFVPGAEWIGTVHVDLRKDNGLSRPDLRSAVASGMRRVSFGLESGSQRLLDLMQKGSSVEANSEFIRNAHEAGLSVRCTMFKGFPGETADDLVSTAEFLERHEAYLDRVRFNEFTVYEDTPIHAALASDSNEYADARLRSIERHYARSRAVYAESGDRAYRRAKARALRSVYRINRKEVRHAARAFDGLM